VREFATAMELYYNDNNGYPATLAALAPNYVGVIPSAPTPVDGNCSTSQNTFTYSQLTSGASYSLTFCLGGLTGGFTAGLHTASPTGII
jgi:hypothetical protein